MGAAVAGHMAHMMPGMASTHDMAAMKPKSGMSHDAMGHMQMGDMGAMDVNDIDYDAYLANDRTLTDPEQIRVEKGGRIRLRIINGATSTAFTIATGALVAELIAVDGQAIVPVSGNAFPVSMGQRLDLRLTIPAGGGAFPILALREDAPERAGIILATSGAPVAKLPVTGGTKGPILDAGLEPRLRALSPLAVKSPDLAVDLALTGSMQGYTWAIEGPLDGDASGEGESGPAGGNHDDQHLDDEPPDASARASFSGRRGEWPEDCGRGARHGVHPADGSRHHRL